MGRGVFQISPYILVHSAAPYSPPLSGSGEGSLPGSLFAVQLSSIFNLKLNVVDIPGAGVI